MSLGAFVNLVCIVVALLLVIQVGCDMRSDRAERRRRQRLQNQRHIFTSKVDSDGFRHSLSYECRDGEEK